MCLDSEFIDVDKYQWPQIIKLFNLNTYSLKKFMSRVICHFNVLSFSNTHLLPSFRTKESMSIDMIIIPCKTAYYNNAHGEIYFPEVGYNYHLWSSSAASESTFFRPLH